jgi:carbamoyl-phosphate synthase large subunit
VRPSYVLGGRAMQIVYDIESLDSAMAELATEGTLGREGGLSAERPVLVDRFLEDAIEVDVDALRDAEGEIVIGGVMEHIEEAGVHSGDSACAIPPQTLSAPTVARIEAQTKALAEALGVLGLINVQWAVKTSPASSGAGGSGAGGSGVASSTVAGSGVGGDEVYILEANPRASRTVPFVSKATGVPLAKIAARVMGGATLAQLRAEGLLHPPAEGGHVAVKEAVLPFNRFPTVDTVLGPEMRSTGPSGWRSPRARPARGTSCRARARSSSRSRIVTSPRASPPPGTSPSSGSASSRPPAPPPRSPRRGYPWTRWWASSPTRTRARPCSTTSATRWSCSSRVPCTSW